MVEKRVGNVSKGNIANSIKEHVDVFRAGSWKPRTSPDSFEGLGKNTLLWLNKVQVDFGLKVITEVGLKGP